jgi:hypothetical protein
MEARMDSNKMLVVGSEYSIDSVWKRCRLACSIERRHTQSRCSFSWVLAFSLVLFANQVFAQDDMIVTNLACLAQKAFDSDHCLYLPWFTPCEYQGVSIDGGLAWWLDCSQVACTNLPPASTNLSANALLAGVSLVPVQLTWNILTGETLLQPYGSTNVITVIAAPNGYQPGGWSYAAGVWRAWLQMTNCPDCWGIETPVPPPTVVVNVNLADLSQYSIYESNCEAQAEAYAAAQASSTPTFAMGGGWAMDFGDDEGDPCLITNYSAPFYISSIAPDGSGDIILQWPSCTNAVYVVQSENSLTPTSSWTDVAWMFGTDQQTSWTDTNAVGMTQNLYQIVRGSPNTLNGGIPYGWAVTYGLDPLDPNLATEDPTGDGIDNLEKYDYGLNPQTSYPLQVTINSGNGFSTNQTISISTTGTPAFTFLEVSLSGYMTNAVILTNSASLLHYVLPNNTNGTFRLFLQYADSHTNTIGPVIYYPIILDTIPPIVMITSPTNGTGNQAFVNLQATVFDPDPTNTNAPGVFRPVKLWINGQQQWHIFNGSQITIPRFPVSVGTNVITVLAQDQAGNQTQSEVTWVVKTVNTNAPQLSFPSFQPNSTTVLPNMSQIWMSGITSNPFAIVTAQVNTETNVTMIVVSNIFGAFLPLDFGSNTVLVMSSDISGNTSTNTFTFVNTLDYQLGITSPAPFGTYANGQPQVISGYVSGYWDLGLPTQTNVVSVTVNGFGTTLSAPDSNSNVWFTTTNAIPVQTNGLPTILNVVVTWANGVIDPPVGILEGYYVTSWNLLTTVYEDQTPCSANGNFITDTSTFDNSYSLGSGEVEIYQDQSSYIDCGSGVVSSYSDTSTNFDSEPSVWTLEFGYEHENLGWPGYDYEGQDFNWDGEMNLIVPAAYAPNTEIIFTFYNVGYAHGTNAIDLSQVTWGGLPPITWDNGNGSVGYLITVNPEQPISISAGDFGFPTGPNTSVNYPDGEPDAGFPPNSTLCEEANAFWFSDFGNSVAISINGSSNLLSLCGESSPSATYNSSVAVGGGNYYWSVSGGLQIVGPSTNASVAVQSTGGSGYQLVQLLYEVNGQPMSAYEYVKLHKPTSVILNNPSVNPNPDPEIVGDYSADTWGYQVLDQYGQPVIYPGLKATEKLQVQMACSETNWPVNAAANIDASSSFFTDTQNAPLGYEFSIQQTIIIHMATYTTNLPSSFGCPVLQNCIIFTGSTIGNSTSCCP